MEVIIVRFFVAWGVAMSFCLVMVCLLILTQKEIFGRITLMTIIFSVLASSLFIICYLLR